MIHISLAEAAPRDDTLPPMTMEDTELRQLDAESPEPACRSDDGTPVPRQHSWFASVSDPPDGFFAHDLRTALDNLITSPDMAARLDLLDERPHDSFNPSSAELSYVRQHWQPRPSIRPRLKRAAETCVRRFSRLGPLRQEMMLLRDRARTELEERRNHRHHVEESQTALLAALSNVCEHLPDVPAFEQARRLYQQLLADQEALIVQADKTTIIDDEMSALYYQILQDETALDKSASTLLDVAESIDWTHTRDSSLISPSGSPSSTPDGQVSSLTEVDPLLTDFFEKTGDVKIMQERLQEVETAHAEARLDRETQYDQGRNPLVSEHDFEAACEQEYREARLDVLAAMEAQELAQTVCKQQGISVEPYFQPLPDLEYLDSMNPSVRHASERAESPSALSVDFPVLTPELARHSTLTLDILLQAHEERTSSRGLRERSMADSTQVSRDSMISHWVGEIMEGEGELRRSDKLFEARPRPTSVRSQPVIGSGLLHRYLTEGSDPRAFDFGKSTASFADRPVNVRRSSSSDMSSMRHYSHEDILNDLRAARDS